MEHKCCSEAGWLLKYDERQNHWYVFFDRDWAIYGSFKAEIKYCPWCGEKLDVIMGVRKENTEIVARWIDRHLGERISFQETYLSLVGAGGLLEQFGVIEPI